MNHKISNIFKSYLLTLDWSDKVSGLVQTANIRVKNGDSTSEKSYPISCDISESACIKGAYQDLSPDSKKKSVMYFEDGGASMVERVGNRMKLQSKLRLVVWLNHSKIQGVDCHVDATGCGTSGDYVIDVIKVLPSTPIQTADFISIMVSDISQVERSVDIFSKYSYNETALQYLMFPYDYFAIDLTVDFTIPCIVPQYVVPPVPVAVTDIDGNDYHSVIIGDQEWLIENLKATTYADGTPIPNLTANVDWVAEDGSAGHDGAYCFYNNDIANKSDYGALYNWYAVVNAHGLAPAGWRVPSEADVLALIATVGGDLISGGKLKEEGLLHWESPNDGATNDYGFTALPGGLRFSDASFGSLTYINQISTTTEDVGAMKYAQIGSHNDTTSYTSTDSKVSGFSVRLMRDV